MQKRQATGVPEGSPEIEINGVSLAVAREGRGVPIVCLHAIAHGGADFAPFAARVRDRFEIIRIDWPRHGRSGGDSEPPSPTHYAQLLAGLLAKLDIERPIIIGNSIGGAAAILYAKANPVRALVLCDSAGLVEVTSIVRLFCAFFTKFFAAGARQARWFGTAYSCYYRFLVLPRAAAAAQRQRIVASGYEMAATLREAWTGFGSKSADIRDVAWSLDIPVWFAWAKNDRVIPLLFCKPAIRRMKRAALTTFSGGHAAFLEQPDAFAAAFAQFAATLDIGSMRAAVPAHPATTMPEAKLG